jgi:hypothetical protein
VVRARVEHDHDQSGGKRHDQWCRKLRAEHVARFVFLESDGATKWTVVVASALPDNTVSTTKIIDQAVTTTKIADNAVTDVKVPVAGISQNKLKTLGGLPGMMPVGAEMMWPGYFPPPGWQFEFGQAHFAYWLTQRCLFCL